ncbi:MAG TPA: M15 family metallopeptidase [Gammaproteobacteria bacterium]|nr:M15 family metallopeptidase [Gammaproteobacteria bacterium]
MKKLKYQWMIAIIFFAGGGMETVDAQSSVKNNIVLIASPEILSIPVQDNKEPMIDVKNRHTLRYGPSPEIPDNTDYTKMRQSVYEKLMQAESHLPKDLHFCLYEAYRSLHLQKMLFDNRFALVKKQHPDWSRDALFIETTRLVSPVLNQDGSHNIPPHSTGGAIDVYLVDEKGNAVDMGIHPKDWMKDHDGSVSLTASKIISREAQKNRKIMSDALLAAGFVNYPTEYWHWSYGDKYWAYHAKQSHAIYESYNNK